MEGVDPFTIPAQATTGDLWATTPVVRCSTPRGVRSVGIADPRDTLEPMSDLAFKPSNPLYKITTSARELESWVCWGGLEAGNSAQE